MVPLVSVLMVTFNHEKYIAQALESILMQITNFKYEIIIGEDCSTDNTKLIIRKFENKYPGRIFPIYHEANVGPMRNVYEFTFPKCTGKYIAALEGDDYWTDPNKLQRQVDFLEANPDFSICFHNMQIIYENSPEKNHLSNIEQKEISDINDLARYNYIYTASCMFRNQYSSIPGWFLDCPVGDYPMHLFNAQFGKIKFINETMAVYRIHDNGIWENKPMTYKQINWINLLSVLIGKFEEKVNNILVQQQIYILKILDLNNIDFSSKEFPAFLKNIIEDYIKQKSHNIELAKEIKILKKSRTYRLVYFLQKPLIKIKKAFKHHS